MVIGHTYHFTPCVELSCIRRYLHNNLIYDLRHYSWSLLILNTTRQCYGSAFPDAYWCLQYNQCLRRTTAPTRLLQEESHINVCTDPQRRQCVVFVDTRHHIMQFCGTYYLPRDVASAVQVGPEEESLLLMKESKLYFSY